MIYTYRVLLDHDFSPPRVHRFLGQGTQVTLGPKESVATIEVEVDPVALVRVMGGRAVRNKSGKCVDGCITVRHKRDKA